MSVRIAKMTLDVMSALRCTMLKALIAKESKGMEDDLIFVMCIHIFALFLVEIFNSHLFGIEALIAMLNTSLTIYFYYKDKNRK